ncbi:MULTISPECIES: hypothetical protein [unclassified Streptomyces]|uniref:hypothetical protein n=1 Tax=unclassified Streptomyces TaxID=2593676 RepID=UPI003D715EDD
MAGSTRRRGMRALFTAACALALFAAGCWFVSDLTGTDLPTERPAWDLGGSGPWVASYARGAAVGSWGAARVCLAVALLLLALEAGSQLLAALRGFAARFSRQAS